MDLQHVDACLACYVMNHCNGPRELLIGVPLFAGALNGDVKNDFLCALRDAEFDPEDKPGFDDDAARAAIDSAFADLDPAAPWAPADGLDLQGVNDEPDGEQCFSWFRFSWT